MARGTARDPIGTDPTTTPEPGWLGTARTTPGDEQQLTIPTTSQFAEPMGTYTSYREALADQSLITATGYEVVEKDELWAGYHSAINGVPVKGYENQSLPFVIVGVRFHDGISQVKGESGSFVSVEAITCDRAAIDRLVKRGRVNPDQVLGFELPFVINDSGTGIKRQIVDLLQLRGVIDVGPAVGDVNPLDKPHGQWAMGAEDAAKGIPLLIHCPRGIRYSEYSNEFTGDKATARTYYIA